MSKQYTRTVNAHGKRNYKISIEEYASANDMANDCAKRTRKDGGWHEPEYGGWAGVKSYDEALNLLRNGYKPVVQEMKETLKNVQVTATKRVAFKNAPVGFAPVVPLALMGVPNSMIDVRVKPIKTKVIDVYYDMACSSMTDSDEIIEVGKKILGSIIELEMQGYKFNLFGVQSYSNDTDADMVIVKIKSSNQPFDLKRMSFPLTHTGFFRVIGFDWYGKCPFTTYRRAYGRALKYTFNSELQSVYKQLFGKNAVCFACADLLHQDASKIKEVLTNVGNDK